MKKSLNGIQQHLDILTGYKRTGELVKQLEYRPESPEELSEVR
jgi:hypothetical protein